MQLPPISFRAGHKIYVTDRETDRKTSIFKNSEIMFKVTKFDLTYLAKNLTLFIYVSNL